MTVLKKVKKPDHLKKKEVYWECLCECGNKIIVPSSNLKSMNTQSCGCSRILAKEMIGLKFGRLIVLEYLEIKNNKTYVRCLCECGNEIILSSSTLKNRKYTILWMFT